MYRLSRQFLLAAVIGGAFCLGVFAWAAWPWSGYFIALVAFIRWKQASPTRTTLGSARWAGPGDLQKAGMLYSRRGLMLGRIATTSSLLEAVKQLQVRNSEAACRGFWGALRGRGALVRLPQAVHTAVFSPTGGGKGVSFVIPFLMTCEDSCIVVDFKGENAMLTAKHRARAFGHKVVLLDPFRMVTQAPDMFNPLDFIEKESPLAIDECNSLANALVIRTGEEKEPHWLDSAEAWIAAMLALVVEEGRDDTRSLQTVRDLFSDPQKLEMAITVLRQSGRMHARMGGQLSHFIDREKASVLTTVSRHLRFLDTPAVAESSERSSFNPAELRRGKMTVYLILPPEFMRSHAALLRLWIGALLRAVIRGGLQEKNKVHFVLDEAASLGHMDAIDDALDKYRGYGVRVLFFWQSLGQVKKNFPEGQEQTLLSNTTQVFFGVNDNATADYVSARIGEETVIVDSGGSSYGRTDQTGYSPQPQNSTSHSRTTNGNWNQQARRLLKPEEVTGLDGRLAITFTPNVPPIVTRLVRYYEEPWLRRAHGPWRRMADACGIFVASAALCAVLVGSALALGVAMEKTSTNPAEPEVPAHFSTSFP